MPHELATRRDVLRGLGALGLGACAFGRAASTPRRGAPNVLFLMPDQLRRQATSFHGDKLVFMPRIEQLARESLVFERAVSTNPVCSAYRTMMLTGRYTHVTGNKLQPEYDNLYKLLSRSGWDVAHIGKWHMTPREFATESEYVPPQVREGVDFAAMYEVSHNYRLGKWFLNDDPEPRRSGAWRPDNLTQIAQEYLATRKEVDKPFFLTLALGPPHNPYTPLRRFNIFQPEEIELRDNVPAKQRQMARAIIAQYYGLVASVDENVQALLSTLEETGQADDTLVVFTSDHGDMLFSQGEEGKRRPWEESIGVPLTIRPCRGVKLEPGRSDKLFSTIDLMPTLLELLGIPIPADLQGRSIFSSERRQAVYLEETSGVKTPLEEPWRGVLTDDGWKYVTSKSHEDWLLYDLNEDPLEMHNLAQKAGHAERRGELATLLREMAKANGDPYFAS